MRPVTTEIASIAVLNLSEKKHQPIHIPRLLRTSQMPDELPTFLLSVNEEGKVTQVTSPTTTQADATLTTWLATLRFPAQQKTAWMPVQITWIKEQADD